MGDLSINELKKSLDYDETTGEFRWLIKTKRSQIGDIAGSLTNSGYIVIGLNNNDYLAHRLAWFYTIGTWPEKQIDHKDGNRKNNSFSNLRLADRSENMRNRKPHRNNTSGFVGVSFESGKWRARIKVDRKLLHIGSYKTKEEAIAARMKAASEYHKEFVRDA